MTEEELTNTFSIVFLSETFDALVNVVSRASTKAIRRKEGRSAEEERLIDLHEALSGICRTMGGASGDAKVTLTFVVEDKYLLGLKD